MSVAPTQRSRILLVDDSMLMRKAASKMLSEEFDVVTATDGEDAWKQVQADHGIQVVFTDLSMPKMDGYALLNTIRGAEDEGTLNMPVIIVTGADNDEAARRKALDMGATDFITKPFSSVDLLARARAHSNYRRIAKRLEEQITNDSLTGLANKAGFLDRLQQDLAYGRRLSQPLTLARIEIDAFRQLFLSHGKARAEALIKHVAQFLHQTVRQEDTTARIGLASFALALPGGQHQGSKGLIERVRKQIGSESISIDGKAIRLTISAAVYTPDLRFGPSAVDALEACERLVQLAVKAGGNCVLDEAATSDEMAEIQLESVEEVAPAPAPRAAKPAAAAPAPKAAAAAPKPAPAQAEVAVASAKADTIDAALQRIEQGDGLGVVHQLPALLKRLLPIFTLLSPRQRAQLVTYLQKLGV